MAPRLGPLLRALCSLSLLTVHVSAHTDSPWSRVAARHHHVHPVQARQGDPTLPDGWTAQGCWLDNVGGRSLGAASFVNSTSMTQELCVDFCNNQNYIFAGVEFAQECYCDNFIENGGALATDQADCNMPCAGDASEICGAGNRLTLFTSGKTPPPKTAVVQTFGDWVSLGCFSEGNGGRTLGTQTSAIDNQTIEGCLTSCQDLGFPLAGAEFGRECYCGSTFQFGGAPATDGCNIACSGNTSEFCGGAGRLNAYNFTGTITVTPPAQGGGGGGGGAPAGPTPTAQTTDLLAPWQYIGCYTEGQNARAMATQRQDNTSLVPDDCLAFCAAGNFSVAGVEFGVQCFCDDLLREAAATAPESDCGQACGGDATIACGGPARLNVYATTPTVEVLPTPTAQTTGLPGSWEFQFCAIEPNNPGRIFPHKITNQVNLTVASCLSLCQTYGFPGAGLEFGQECWCGDVADVTNNSAGEAPLTDCDLPCTGDPTSFCGSGDRLLLYFWKGDPLFLWHTPEVTGHYEFLVGGPIVPLITTLGLNNKVTFLEKLGSGPPNSTHAYELDYTLAADATKSWREMHVQTDVFCSGGLVLPDKAGRVLTVGGWSLESTFGVRLYTPDGSLGTNGTNDWQENEAELHLQVGRWYPGSMIMSNGSILVVGGEIGANDKPEPTLEILPTVPGNPAMFMQFLKDTDPFNLYPFLFVLPGGGIFVLVYNTARILDPVTFDTVKVFPTIPGAVDQIAGRTYPLEGASVILPMTAPYTDPAQILTCGGSPGGGAVTLDNCVLIAPEVDGADWQVERMPFNRVMPNLVALPDGTYLIVNGAGIGTAGFGLADEPTLTALLYDPTLPVGSRISILNTTIVARMYHSEAILMHDARVLVSGSDPLTTVLNPDGSVNEQLSFPEEYRVEVYVPPYLSNNLKQPTFAIAEDQSDWDYGATYTITNVTLFQGTTDTLRISLLGAVSSTHGNNFGSRTLFPAFTCDAGAKTCAITAPPDNKIAPPGWFQLFVLDGPTPSFSQWVRIGGDPAQLGNWPDLPDFVVPGV